MISAGELPLQIAWFEGTVPATLVGFTVTVTTPEVADAHTPLVTTAR